MKMSKSLPLGLLFATLAGFAGEARAQVSCPASPPPVPALACGNPEFRSCAIDVGGIPRHFCVHEPSSPPGVPPDGRPVVLGFHGRGGEAAKMVALLDHLTEQGMVLVAPTALPTSAACVPRWRHMDSTIPTWADLSAADACDQAKGPWPAHSANRADLDFIATLMTEIDDQIEVQGFYALGFSSGAGMVLQLFITEPFASRIEGFGVIANGLTDEKIAAQAGGGSGPFSANADTRRPVILIAGTADKVLFPGQRVIETLEALDGTECPPLTSPREVIECFLAKPMALGLGPLDFVSRLDETVAWLTDFNDTQPRAIEGSYPDRGHGAAPAHLQDATVVVRQDYLPSVQQGGQPVTVLTVLGGGHNVPGARGDHAPCEPQNCDIRGIDEALQFWRATAGFETLWR